MIFEKAINDAATMFLFDRRSQQQLQEMAEGTVPKSKDRFLIRLTQAAFTYYNDYEAQGWDIRNSLRQAQALLQEVKAFRGDRVFFTLALRMEVDLLLHASRLNFEEAPKKDKIRNLFNEEDSKALSICDTLLKNFPPTLEPFPNAWYTSLIPLFPTFHDEVLRFYEDRVKENRIEVLVSILTKIRAELSTAASMILAKRFLSKTELDLTGVDAVYKLLLASVRDVMARLEDKFPPNLQVVADVSLPKGISQGQLELAVKSVQGEIDGANAEKDMPKYTAGLLQLGVLNFLRENPPGAIQALVNTLRASRNLGPELRKARQYRHETFPDIPFMIGTSFVKMGMADSEEDEDDLDHLSKSKSGLQQAIVLNPGYHQAYVNLVLAMRLSEEPGLDRVIQLYLERHGKDLSRLDAHLFRNLAVLALRSNGSATDPEALKWLIVSHFSTGGELTKGKKMLQELKTLYVLNAHEISSRYLEGYRSALRQKDQEFVLDIEDDAVHSALLFYISHAFASRSLKQGKSDTELAVDHESLDQSIDLNAESLYFNGKNGSALRLVDTQFSIIQFALQRSEKRWEQINTNMSNRFAFYENYLREMKSFNFLQERLGSLKLEQLVPEIAFSENARLRMDLNLTEEQRERLKTRVQTT